MFLLDTNACIRILNGTSPSLVNHLRTVPRSLVRLSSVVKAELLYGARKSTRIGQPSLRRPLCRGVWPASRGARSRRDADRTERFADRSDGPRPPCHPGHTQRPGVLSRRRAANRGLGVALNRQILWRPQDTVLIDPAAMDKSKINVILSEGWVGPRGAKDLRDDRGSAPGFVRRSFAPTPAPALLLRMTLGWS